MVLITVVVINEPQEADREEIVLSCIEKNSLFFNDYRETGLSQMEHSKEIFAVKVAKLKQRANALILAHNYQPPDIQDVADFVGDSLELAKKAASSTAGVIIFCGVRFMAETAAILAPQKKVILPEPTAGCPMADMAEPDSVESFKRSHPDAKIVCYVNSSAEVKAVSDVCCTSANAVSVVSKVDGEVIFLPDQYLGTYVASRTGKKIHLWPGYCPAHVRITPYDIEELKKKYPDAYVMVHPECRPEVTSVADEVTGTGGMVRAAKRVDRQNFIVGTETGMIYRLKKEAPGKNFIPASQHAVCPNMKKISVDKLVFSLEKLHPEIRISDDLRRKARKPLEPLLG